MSDSIDRKAAIDLVKDVCDAVMSGCESWYDTETGDEVYKDILEVDAILKCNKEVRIALRNMPSAQPESEKYECYYNHTDCIWYRPEARNRCPATCAQYRDGWNDAMNYIFRDGKGYRPYRRGEQYDE